MKESRQRANLPSVLYPNCLHTTFALLLVHKSSQTVPHAPLLHISTSP